MSYMSDGLTWLASQLRDSAGQTVGLSRARASTAGVTAVVLDHDEVLEDQLSMTAASGRAWLVAKASYSIGFHGKTTPQRGDRITDAAGDAWEVLPGGAMPAVESYGDGTEWLIRTKRVAA